MGGCHDLRQGLHGGTYTVNYSVDARTLDFLGAVNYVLNGNSNTWADINAWLHPSNGNIGAAIQVGIWKSLYETSGDLVVWADTDVRNWHPRMVYGTLGPLLHEPRLQYVKGYYQRPIVEAGIRQKFGVIVVAIRHAEGTMEFNPSPESVIRAGDELVVLGRPQSVKALEERVAA